jgi:exopolysaccharide biosynthesis polyprenyl glycosylphosphotransferase
MTETFISQFFAVLFSDLIMYIVFSLISGSINNVFPLLATIGIQVILSVLWTFFTKKWYFATFGPSPSAVIYNTKDKFSDLIDTYYENSRYKVIKKLSVKECVKNINTLKEGISTVFISRTPSHERNQILKYCLENNLEVLLLPKIGDLILAGAKPVHIFNLPILRLSPDRTSPEYLFIKRLLDIVLSLFGSILVSPVLVITAIAIKTYDHGPVLYKQKRLTKDGKEFYIHKFRSMKVNAEKDGVARLSSGENDDRITPVGRAIRKCRIDELPQLFDILDGNLSIVGPRPERPEIAEEYYKNLPEFRLRLKVKAGLTGYAQVYGKYNTDPYNKLQLDLMYIAQQGFVTDFKIVMATVKVVFIPESTEGIAKDAVNAMDDHAVSKS